MTLTTPPLVAKYLLAASKIELKFVDPVASEALWECMLAATSDFWAELFLC